MKKIILSSSTGCDALVRRQLLNNQGRKSKCLFVHDGSVLIRMTPRLMKAITELLDDFPQLSTLHFSEPLAKEGTPLGEIENTFKRFLSSTRCSVKTIRFRWRSQSALEISARSDLFTFLNMSQRCIKHSTSIEKIVFMNVPRTDQTLHEFILNLWCSNPDIEVKVRFADSRQLWRSTDECWLYNFIQVLMTEDDYLFAQKNSGVWSHLLANAKLSRSNLYCCIKTLIRTEQGQSLL